MANTLYVVWKDLTPNLLLHETPTIPADMGIFLGTTYRMHSAVNRFISEHIYEGKLDSHPDNDKRIIEVPAGYEGLLDQNAGVVFIPVHHEVNTQAALMQHRVVLIVTRCHIKENRCCTSR